MSKRRLGVALVAAALLAGAAPTAAAQPAEPSDLADYVDPMIGTYAPGFVNPGPVLPHGMVGLGPDTEGPFNYGGYFVHNTLITGFSHTHMSAGVPQAGQIPVMPVVGDVRLDDPASEIPGLSPVPAYASAFNHATETAEAGYYRVLLERYGIDVELTATHRAGMHRYTFPAGDASVVIDVSRDLKGYHPAEVAIVDEDTVTGSVTTTSPTHTVYFAARFDRPFSTAATFSGNQIERDRREATGTRVGAVVGFGDASVVQAKVGISYVDVAGAMNNLATEIPGWDFDAVRRAARTGWNRALERIEVSGGTLAQRRSFYTALYHAQLFPNLFSDVDGRYVGFDDRIHTTARPQYTQFSLWDSYRGQNQLLAVIDPAAYRDMVESLMNDYRQGGSLPRWALANRAPNYMSGDPVIPFIGEAWCRGLVEPAAQAEIYAAMRELVEARPAAYLAPELGYDPTAKPRDLLHVVEGGPRNAGTTLEYGVAEFALALMADGVGAAGETAELLGRADNFRNLLDPQTRWIRPRHADGSWLQEFAPENGYGFQEGTSWQYSWLGMQDLRGLFDLMGGDDVVNERLDTFFVFPASATVPIVPAKVQNQATLFGLEYRGNQYAPGNEHDLHAPFLYNYAGAPWKTQAAARGVASIFTPTPDGLPGNDDLGALSGWLVWTMLGLYPMTPGAPLYTIASPVFERAVVHRPDGDLVIAAPGASEANKYVQSAALNGSLLAKSWFTEEQIAGAAELTLQMGPLPNTAWAAAPEAAPPSASTNPPESFGCVPAERDPTTVLVYDGDTSAKVGDTAILTATLTGVSDGPLVGETVTFVFREQSYEAVTDPSGRAAVEVRLTGPPGSYEVTARYAGSERHLGSEDSAAFTVTTGP